MPSISILIQRKDAPPVLKEIPADALVHLPDVPWTLALVEEGMGSGLPSIGLALPLPDGRMVLAENSLSNLIMALAGARGAFPEAFVGGVFDPAIIDALAQSSLRAVQAMEILDDGAKDAAWRVLNARQVLTPVQPIVNPLQARVDKALAILEDRDKVDGPEGKADHQTTVINRARKALLGGPDA